MVSSFKRFRQVTSSPKEVVDNLYRSFQAYLMSNADINVIVFFSGYFLSTNIIVYGHIAATIFCSTQKPLCNSDRRPVNQEPNKWRKTPPPWMKDAVAVYN